LPEKGNTPKQKQMKINKYKKVWEIWLTSKDKLYGYVFSRFKNKELAEEVTQEVVLKLHNSCCSQKEIKNLNAWLFQIAHNVSLDILKKEAKHRDLYQNESESNTSNWEELTNFLGISQKEIAVQLQLGLSATKSRIQRAREMLKQEIKTCFNLEMDKKGVPISAELKNSCDTLENLQKKK